jgi:hypothetical protein
MVARVTPWHGLHRKQSPYFCEGVFTEALVGNTAERFLPQSCVAMHGAVRLGSARHGTARHGTAQRNHRFPHWCVRVFSRELFIGPLPSNTRYNIISYNYADIQ